MNGKAVPLITNASFAPRAKEEGFQAEAIAPGETKTLGAFTIQGLAAHHEDLPGSTPDNIAFLISETLLHPGDSLLAEIPYGTLPILCLPIVTPWATKKQAFEYAERIHPQHIVPVHDGNLKDFFRKSQDAQAMEYFKDRGITVHALEAGGSFEA
jgi:L-ascorbate metabolism protein UlaG (beta-lactamase superfamily)